MRAENQREAAMGKQGAKVKAAAKAGPNTGAKGRNEPGFDNARVLTADEYFKRVRHHNVRPAKWSGEDMMETLKELGIDSLGAHANLEPRARYHELDKLSAS